MLDIDMLDIRILSAKSNYLKNSYQDKIDWVKEHLHMSGPHVHIVAYPQDKQKLCKTGDVLIDDNTKNCSEWINAGGTAIIHASAAQTIRKLRELDWSQMTGIVYVDLDGVMADYDTAYRALGGDPDEKGGKKANRFKQAPHFYRDLKLMPDAMELWHFLHSYQPHTDAHKHVQEAFQAIAETPTTPNLVEAFEKRKERLCYCSEYPIPAMYCENCNAA
jgi:5'(3')-deoxyribonucleotidase